MSTVSSVNALHPVLALRVSLVTPAMTAKINSNAMKRSSYVMLLPVKRMRTVVSGCTAILVYVSLMGLLAWIAWRMKTARVSFIVMNLSRHVGARLVSLMMIAAMDHFVHGVNAFDLIQKNE